MADSYSSVSSGISGPASNAAAVTPGATALAFVTRAIYVGGDGDLTVTMLGGGNIAFTGLTAGSILPVRATHILAASTATGIVAIW